MVCLAISDALPIIVNSREIISRFNRKGSKVYDVVFWEVVLRKAARVVLDQLGNLHLYYEHRPHLY